MDAAISVDGLTKRYGDHIAVDDVSFRVEQGESFGILGPNGAGKTTTLEMIEGLRKPDGGEITLLGQPVWPDPRRIQPRIGVQLQSTSLFDMLTARELLELFARFYLRTDAAERARIALALVGLESKAGDYAKAPLRRPAAAAGDRARARARPRDRVPGRAHDRASTRRPGTTCGT